MGGVRIVDQKIDVGREPGHQYINQGKTLEELIGGRNLQVKYGKRVEEINDVRVWEEIIGNLAMGMVNVTVVWSPNIVILGGSLAKSIDLEKLKMAVSQRLTIYPWVPKIVKAKLLDQAGLWGGLALMDK